MNIPSPVTVIVLLTIIGVGLVAVARQVFQLSQHVMESERRRREYEEEMERRVEMLALESEHNRQRYRDLLDRQQRAIPYRPDRETNTDLIQFFQDMIDERPPPIHEVEPAKKEPSPTSFERILKDDES